MFKKLVAMTVAVFMVMAMSVIVKADLPAGVELNPGAWCGATINVAEAGFVEGRTYRIVYEIEMHEFGSNPGWRIRWCENNIQGPFDDPLFNDTTNNAHSSDAAMAAAGNAVVNQVPAAFHPEHLFIPPGTTGTITVYVTYGAQLPDLNPATRPHIGIFGYWGGQDYTVNSVTITDVTPEQQQQTNNQVTNQRTSDNAPFALAAVGLALLAAVLFLRRKVNA